jgi:hypothetical protein
MWARMERSPYDRDGFNTTFHAKSADPRASARRNARAADATVAVSHLETIKRVGKFALMIVLVTAVFAAIAALKVAIWIPRFSH